MMKIKDEELVESLRAFALGLRGAGHIAGAELMGIAADRIEKLEMDLEVTRMNLGDTRSELNRKEDELTDLLRELATGALNAIPNDWGEYPPDFPREGM